MITTEQQTILDKHTKSAPVNVATVASKFGLAVYEANLPPGVSGMLVHDEKYKTESGFVCFVDKNEPVTRQRFTAAHEIGHFLLHREQIGDHHEDNYLLRSEGFSSRQEIDANRFAADLLMPRDLIAKHMSEGQCTVEELSNCFNVSRIAMGIRLGLPT